MMNLLLLCFLLKLQLDRVEGSMTSLVTSNKELQTKVVGIFEDDNIFEELFPVLKKSCVKEALDPFLPQCLLDGFETVSSSTRMETAVKLSLCQFEASGLDNIPLECSYTRDTENMMTCMLELETSNQWWTTYNGYYQNLPMLCVTQDPMFQKEQIIKTFLNITTMVKEMNVNWDIKLKDYMGNVDSSIAQNLNNVDTRLNSTLTKVEEVNKNIEEEFQEMFVNFKQNKQLFSDDLKQKDEDMLNEIQTLQHIIENISSKIKQDNIIQKLEETSNNSLALWDGINAALGQNKQERIKDQEEIAVYVSNIKAKMESLNEEIGSISQISLGTIETDIQNQLENINNQFISEWLSLTQILNKDIRFWNEIISDNFNMISRKLEGTIEKIDYMENKVNKLFKIFACFNRIFGNCFNFVWELLINCKKLLSFVLLLPVLKFILPNFKLFIINKKIYWFLIILGVFSGNHIGFRIFLRIFATKRLLN
ncbi:nuclear fusion protein Kar5p [Monosporozyma servazzii]